MSAEDRYKIDKTAMGDVMSRGREKDGVEAVAAESKVMHELEEGMEEEELEEGMLEEFGLEMSINPAEEKELTTELEDILRSCSQTQSKSKALPAFTETSGKLKKS